MPKLNNLPFPDNLLLDLKIPIESPLSQDQMDGLLFAMAAVDKRKRTVLSMRYIRGMTNPAIGRELGGLTRARVGMIIQDALEKLKEAGVIGYVRRGLSDKEKHLLREQDEKLTSNARFKNRTLKELGMSSILIKRLEKAGVQNGGDLIKLIESDEWESGIRGVGPNKMIEITRVFARNVR